MSYYRNNGSNYNYKRSNNDNGIGGMLLGALIALIVLCLTTAVVHEFVGVTDYVELDEKVVELFTPDSEEPGENVEPPIDNEQPGENVTPGTDVEPGDDLNPGEDNKDPEVETPEVVETLTFDINYASEDPESGYAVLSGNSTQIIYEEGMTWSEWVDSKYNTIGACVEGDFIRISGGYLYVEDLTTPGIFMGAPSVSPSSVIGTERVMVDA